MPGIADNALVKAAPFIERLGAFTSEPRLIPEVEGFLATLVADVPAPASALATAREIAPLAAELIEPLLGMTVAPTMDARLRQAQRHPGALRGDGRRPAAPRPDARGSRGGAPCLAGRGRVRARELRAAGWHALADRRPALGRSAVVRRRGGAGCGRGADLRRRLHRLALAARGVRHRRLRVLPSARDATPKRRRA